MSPPEALPAEWSSDTAARALGVSRETIGRLDAYVDLLRKWQRRMNLIAPSTLDHVWRRHILDSGQLKSLLPEQTKTLIDIGSGAGFPGLVLAIMGVPEVHLVESDRRKAAFLAEAGRITGAPVVIHACRIENLEPFPVDVVTARACAPLDRLLELAAPFLALGAVGLFAKGREAEQELTQARERWKMEAVSHPSRTEADAKIIVIRHAERR